ncbi:unnamed protein product [Mycetohabitans rhizoxinica HKI 454]|uniref:Uncharacterized protein n=1 Tax=Mycetohabitans rhizoxinica (strain DSM 19002 / CIP 109453 / HKI 454) TaxID=882378 RepID=E5AT36_MYCRK|nr:unnamed protein product [Mycetohabitans rhizoxinica HKI 454]
MEMKLTPTCREINFFQKIFNTNKPFDINHLS